MFFFLFTNLYLKQQIIQFPIVLYLIQNWLLLHILFVAQLNGVKSYPIVILFIISLIINEAKNVFYVRIQYFSPVLSDQSFLCIFYFVFHFLTDSQEFFTKCLLLLVAPNIFSKLMAVKNYEGS